MILCQVSGAPASGKTTGARFLDPSKTFYIDCDEKGLSWKGWKKSYNEENKNYMATSDISKVYQIVKRIAETKQEINCIVIDTINTIMSNEEVEILKNPTRDQWKDLAIDIYELYKMIRQLKREDIVVFVMAHVEPYEVNGVTHYRTMTNGKKLSKLNLNSFLRYNLYTSVDHKHDGSVSYNLITKSDGTTEARSVMGVFNDSVVENNLEQIRAAIVAAETIE